MRKSRRCAYVVGANFSIRRDDTGLQRSPRKYQVKLNYK